MPRKQNLQVQLQHTFIHFPILYYDNILILSIMWSFDSFRGP